MEGEQQGEGLITEGGKGYGIGHTAYGIVYTGYEIKHTGNGIGDMG